MLFCLHPEFSDKSAAWNFQRMKGGEPIAATPPLRDPNYALGPATLKAQSDNPEIAGKFGEIEQQNFPAPKSWAARGAGWVIGKMSPEERKQMVGQLVTPEMRKTMMSDYMKSLTFKDVMPYLKQFGGQALAGIGTLMKRHPWIPALGLSLPMILMLLGRSGQQQQQPMMQQPMMVPYASPMPRGGGGGY